LLNQYIPRYDQNLKNMKWYLPVLSRSIRAPDKGESERNVMSRVQ